eukprot:1742040-Pleurochrysis_carterae.AAC.3
MARCSPHDEGDWAWQEAVTCTSQPTPTSGSPERCADAHASRNNESTRSPLNAESLFLSLLASKLHVTLSNTAIPDVSQERTNPEVGVNESRVDRHNSRFGMLQLNKQEFHIFPFTFVPLSKMIERSTGEAPPPPVAGGMTPSSSGRIAD